MTKIKFRRRPDTAMPARKREKAVDQPTEDDQLRSKYMSLFEQRVPQKMFYDRGWIQERVTNHDAYKAATKLRKEYTPTALHVIPYSASTCLILYIHDVLQNWQNERLQGCIHWAETVHEYPPTARSTSARKTQTSS